MCTCMNYKGDKNTERILDFHTSDLAKVSSEKHRFLCAGEGAPNVLQPQIHVNTAPWCKFSGGYGRQWKRWRVCRCACAQLAPLFLWGRPRLGRLALRCSRHPLVREWISAFLGWRYAATEIACCTRGTLWRCPSPRGVWPAPSDAGRPSSRRFRPDETDGRRRSVWVFASHRGDRWWSGFQTATCRPRSSIRHRAARRRRKRTANVVRQHHLVDDKFQTMRVYIPLYQPIKPTSLQIKRVSKVCDLRAVVWGENHGKTTWRVRMGGASVRGSGVDGSEATKTRKHLFHVSLHLPHLSLHRTKLLLPLRQENKRHLTILILWMIKCLILITK